MNLVTRMAAAVQRSIPAGAGMSLMDLDNLMAWAAYGMPTYTGKSVSPLSAMQSDAVWACIDVLSGDFATAPTLPYRRTGRYLSSGKPERELATDHYLFPLLTHAFNPYLTAWRGKQLAMTWLGLWGNAYFDIEISGRGQVTALWPWRPDRVKFTIAEDGSPLYTYRMNDGTPITLPHERILHLRGLGVDGWRGLSPIEIHRQGIALDQAMQEHAARFYGNGARPLGVLKHPGKLDKSTGVEEVRKAWEAVHGGLSNSHRIAILQEAMDYKEIGLNMVDAQYLESQRFSKTSIARIYRVPPHRIGDLTSSTNNNIEHQGLEYVNYGIGPWGANIDNELAFALLSQREAATIFVETRFNHLLRGDLTAQGLFIANARQNGVLDGDEIRDELFGLNPHPSGDGSHLWKPLNMGSLVDPQPAAAPTKQLPPVDNPATKNGAYRQ